MKKGAKKLSFVLAGMILLLGLTTMAWAEEFTGPLTIQSIEATAYKELYVTDFPSKYGMGMQEVLKEDGKLYLSVDVTFAAPWTETIDSVPSIDADKIKLLTADGFAIPMTGYFSRYGEFELSTNYFSPYRPWDWDTKPRPIKYNAVFAIPSNASSLKLQFGEVTADITGTIKIKSQADPADLFSVEILAARAVESVKRQGWVGDLEPITTISFTSGKIIEVRFKVMPTGPNAEEPDLFYWTGSMFSIVCDNGFYGPNLGETFSDGISYGVGHSQNSNEDGTWNTDESSMFFAIPADVKTFKLVYGNTVVAEGALP